MEGKIYIEFTEDEINRITKYMELVEADTIQNAILNAVSIVMDDDPKMQ